MDRTQIYDKHGHHAVSALKSRVDKEKAILLVMERGLNRLDSEEFIDRVMYDNRMANTAFGLKALIIGSLGVLVMLGMFLHSGVFFQSGRLFFMALALFGLAMAGGAVVMLWPSPYKVRLTIDGEDE